MNPYLFSWVFEEHVIRVPSFGFFLALAFSVAYFLSLRNARKLDIPPRDVEFLFLLILVSSAIGGRLFHVFFEEPHFYWKHPEKVIAVWEGGFTLYGAVLAALAAIFIYCRYRTLSFSRVIDLAATSSLLSISIGRVGCFLAGCCWGKVCSFPWAVTYSHPEAFNSVRGLTVHPTQIYEALGALTLFIWCQRLLFNSKKSGETGLKALLGYSMLRFLVEFFRGDSYRGFIFQGTLSYSQLISLIIALAASVFLVNLKRATDPS